jgi:hypothetical protein
MKSDTDDEALRARLEHAAANLDDLTVARLRAARKRALAAAQKRPLLVGWIPLSAAAAAFLAVTMTTLWWRAPEPTAVANSEELELSLTHDDPEFFTDLEFYDWIRREQDAG